MTPRPLCLALFLALTALSASAQAPPALQSCAAHALKPAALAPKEHLVFKLDVVGVELGTFEMSIGPAPASERVPSELLIQARGKTSDLVATNARRVDGWSSVLVTGDGRPVRYREELDEDTTHRSQTVEFPPRAGALLVQATTDGEPEPVSLAATPAAQDLLSGLFLVRRQELSPGTQLCADIYGARRMWRVQGKVADKPEQVETPLGKLEAIRVDTVATRTDDPRVVREGHVWITTDERRLPLVILANVRGRFLRAQLTEATAGRPLHKKLRRAER